MTETLSFTGKRMFENVLRRFLSAKDGDIIDGYLPFTYSDLSKASIPADMAVDALNECVVLRLLEVIEPPSQGYPRYVRFGRRCLSGDDQNKCL